MFRTRDGNRHTLYRMVLTIIEYHDYLVDLDFRSKVWINRDSPLGAAMWHMLEWLDKIEPYVVNFSATV